jgi:membrane protease YdiL (CAAX protease family)
MNALALEHALLSVVAWAILSGIVLSWGWVLRQLWTGQSLFPARPLVEWHGRLSAWTPLVVLLIYAAGTFVTVNGYVWATRGLWGQNRQTRQAPPVAGRAGEPDSTTPAQQPEPQTEHRHPDASRKSDRTPAAPEQPALTATERDVLSPTEQMLLQTLLNGAMLLLLPAAIRATSGARLRDLGLCFADWKRQASVGLVAVFLAIPVVYTIQACAVLVTEWLERRREAHPLEKMLRDQFSGDNAYLAIVSAVVLAPLVEELLFRGIFQRWLMKLLARNDQVHGPRGPHQAGQEPTAHPLLREGPARVCEEVVGHDAKKHSAGASEVVDQPRPDSSPSRTSPARRRQFSPWVAILLTSLFFAAVHGPQWPAPIPLFVLSLAIGIVYYRTGSLIAAVCMHAAFNGLSTLFLLLALSLGEPAQEPRPAPVPGVERNSSVEKERHPAGNVDTLVR